MTADAFRAAESILGHRFGRAALLEEALTHRSAARGRRGAGSNERLEFVGDRVLGLLVAEWLVERFPAEQEGELGRRMAQLVSAPVLAAIGGELGFETLLTLGSGEARAGVGRQANAIADAVEAAIGALYLDAGLEPARAFVRRAWEGAVAEQQRPPKDPKTALQEWLMARGRPLPEYGEVDRAGPSHQPVFTVRVTAGDQAGEGRGANKREAERLAAAALLEALR